jgi:hypothetical protein
MSRCLLTLSSQADRSRAIGYVRSAPAGSRLELKTARRTLAQNAKMWAMLTDIAEQKFHYGRKFTPDQWKVLFLHASGHGVQFIPSLDGATFLPWGQSSRELSKEETSGLIEFMLAWGAANGVTFHGAEPASPSPAAKEME